MQSWVDTTVAKNNTWLVLVIHGVDGLGYEALPHTLLDTYFQYIKAREDKLWVATFGDVTKYMRERESVKVTGHYHPENGKILITIDNPLDAAVYNIPLTLKTYVTSGLKKVSVKAGKQLKTLSTLVDENGTYVLFQTLPGKAVIVEENRL